MRKEVFHYVGSVQLTPTKISGQKIFLGPTVAEYHSNNGALFSVYRAKRLYASRFISHQLKHLVMQARKSYLRYGSVPLFDGYDAKSAVYLTRVCYQQLYDGVFYPTEEWLSTRFVPADGLPHYTEDLKFYLCEEKPLVRWLLDSRFNQQRDIVKRIVTISRICGIAPVSFASFTQTKKQTSISPAKLAFTGIAFALMNKQFLDDCAASYDYQFFTGLFHDTFIEKKLTAIISGKRIPAFTDAYTMLGISNSSKIQLSRETFASYFYKFPSYFFNMDELFAVLTDLLNQGQITTDTLAYHMNTLQHPDTWMKTRALFQRHAGDRLGRLMGVDGTLYKSSLQGEELREIINKHVSDGPRLRIMHTNAWRKSIEEYLQAQGIKGYSIIQ